MMFFCRKVEASKSTLVSITQAGVREFVSKDMRLRCQIAYFTPEIFWSALAKEEETESVPLADDSFSDY